MLAATWSAILPGRINWKPACAVRAWNAVGEPGALFCCVECLDVRKQLLEDALYLCAGDEPCSCNVSWIFLVEKLILYVEQLSWHGMTGKLAGLHVVLVVWIICGNTTVLEED